MNPEQAFTGIKVLAVARVVAAPFAAYQLAMHGADVIRIEHPELGDSARTSGYPPTPFQEAKMGHNFVAYNANTRSVSLYINTPAGQEVFRRLEHVIRTYQVQMVKAKAPKAPRPYTPTTEARPTHKGLSTQA